MRKLFCFLVLLIIHIFICYNYTYDNFNECKIKNVNNEGKRLKASKSFNGNLNREILYNYFYNLGDYQANNIGGSCAFVSLTSVLSYYDSIKNDNVIPEEYERKNDNARNYNEAITSSPGVYRTTFSVDANDPLYHSKLYEYISDSYHYDYESYLIKKYNELNNNYNDQTIIYSIGEWEYENLLNTVLDVNFTTENDYAPNSSDAETLEYKQRFIDETKNSIDIGIPVILHLKGNYDYSHHSVVAYDYDEDYIYCNMGWGRNQTHIRFENDDFKHIYYVSKINIEASEYGHSNNLKYNGEDHCYCGEKTHEHTYYEYIDYSEPLHKSKCRCGYSKLEGHVYDPRQIHVNIRVFGFCLLCGHSKGGNVI